MNHNLARSYATLDRYADAGTYNEAAARRLLRCNARELGLRPIARGIDVLLQRWHELRQTPTRKD